MSIKAKILFIALGAVIVLLGAVGSWYLYHPSTQSFQATENTLDKADVVNLQSPINIEVEKKLGDWDFYPGDYSKKGLIGMSLPGRWRPYSESSIWNTPIAKDVTVHPDSQKIINTLNGEAENIRFVRYFSAPIWVVNSENMSQYQVKSDRIYDFWDKNRDGLTDDPIPIDRNMWGEQSPDGHIIIVDPFKMKAWEMSTFKWDDSGVVPIPTATTFNVWDLKGSGYALPFEGERWRQRGARGSGIPMLAGLIRPEEIAAGEIRHAMVFMFLRNRKGNEGKEMFYSPPAARSDGEFEGDEYPIEGMHLQLNPELTDVDFDTWGLTKEAKIVARALQRYGMFLADNGGSMSIGVQLMAPVLLDHVHYWDKQFPELYKSITKIPTNQFRLINSGKLVTE